MALPSLPAPARVRLAGRTAAIAPFRVMEVLERAWALERAGRSVIRLCVGEPDFPTPAPVLATAGAALARGSVGYTPSLGLPQLREAIAGWSRDRFGVDVPARRVVVTTGASGALLLALAALVDRDDEVLVADPGYPCNRHFLATFEGTATAVPVGVRTRYQLTAEAVDTAWGPRTVGVVAATPSNPTGTRIADAELGRILAALAHGPDAVVLNSFSKTYAMTGWRLGWMVCRDAMLAAVEALAQNLFIAAPTPAQWGALACFTDEVRDEVAARVERFRRRRDLLVDGLRRIGFGVPVVPDGAFYVYADAGAFTSDSADFAARVLEIMGVAITPGDDFGHHLAARHVRFSVTRPSAEIVEALDRLARYVGA